MAKKTTKKLKGTPLIKSSLKAVGKFYYGEGKTILEAIQSLKPEIARGIGILTLEKDGIVREKILQPRTMFGLFGPVSSTTKDMAIKTISLLFDAKTFE